MPVAPAPSTRAPSPEGGHRFAAALQSALTVGDVENAFLESAGEVIPAPGYGLYRIDADSGSMIDFKAQVETDFLTDYETYGRQDDPLLEFVLRQNEPVDSSRVVSRQAWEDCAARAALDVGGYYHSLEAPVIVSGILYGTMNFARREGQPAFSDADLVAARLAGEQLGLATERALRYEESGHRASRLEHSLDHIPQALVVTDLEARVLFRNRAARAGERSASTAALVDDSIVEAMEEFRALGKRVYTRTAVDRQTQRRVVVKSFRLPDRDDAALTLVFEQVPDQADRLPSWDVLSKREQEIAELVSQGLTNKQIAERAFVSENTVKQHLKRVFAKTDVRNRAELMQRIWAAGGARPS
ncbi:LuxR C-terminal-related transcriptional regulator [Amycolatopsis rhabdoformis]|uniref:LuxR C-terminal-related transcriptional regulator n=1 Tax=Amycolatopsis rhabdoformis TaxID=1448059 RepID=A0ABZ1ICT2_9PSEU|nr:LuxR C-terminal-related transcriptional regulator [Amycolatopsis rhabdoformis]WSE31948.1 LuxR C-terminal-related transcriptional regulator [Amycolatopsis rhabdoformis]